MKDRTMLMGNNQHFLTIRRPLGTKLAQLGHMNMFSALQAHTITSATHMLVWGWLERLL